MSTGLEINKNGSVLKVPVFIGLQGCVKNTLGQACTLASVGARVIVVLLARSVCRSDGYRSRMLR